MVSGNNNDVEKSLALDSASGNNPPLSISIKDRQKNMRTMISNELSPPVPFNLVEQYGDVERQAKRSPVLLNSDERDSGITLIPSKDELENEGDYTTSISTRRALRSVAKNATQENSNDVSLLDRENNASPTNDDASAIPKPLSRRGSDHVSTPLIPEAFLVKETKVVIATPLEPQLPWWKQTRAKFLLCLFCVVLVVMAIALGVAVSSNNTTTERVVPVSSASPPISSTPTSEPISSTPPSEPISSTPMSEPINSTPMSEPINSTPTSEPSTVFPSTQHWLSAHNNRRQTYHEGYGVPYRALKWSTGLKDLAQEWADENAEQCKNRNPGDYGVNSQMVTGDSLPLTAQETLTIWQNRISQGYPANGSMTQVLWRATEYVGCASASGDGCAFSVCYYAKPGNCGMGESKGDNWEAKVYADNSGCLPECPPEGCS